MALIEYRLDGTVNKVDLAIKRIKLSILSEEPLYVCYSGGKDSKVIRHLMGMSGVSHELHYNLTTVDIPSVVREIMDDKEVIVEKARYADGTQKTMWNLIVKKHMPPTRICRYCCSELKEASGKGRICVTGVRAAESFSRAKNAAEAKIFGSNRVELIHNMDNAETLAKYQMASDKEIRAQIKQAKIDVLNRLKSLSIYDDNYLDGYVFIDDIDKLLEEYKND